MSAVDGGVNGPQAQRLHGDVKGAEVWRAGEGERALHTTLASVKNTGTRTKQGLMFFVMLLRSTFLGSIYLHVFGDNRYVFLIFYTLFFYPDRMYHPDILPAVRQVLPGEFVVVGWRAC